MKIYRVVPDVNRYQRLLPSDEAIWKTDLLTFDGTEKMSTWQMPSVYIFNPKKKRGDFFYLTAGSLVCNDSTCNQMQDLLEMSGELLPLVFNNENYHVVNATECVNVLDEVKTIWACDDETGE